ncbi:MAG: acetylornithine transaminase [Oscillospiraceae bacterium]|jgi:acetylornithine/N-succinyldiaminopimelate aminotransferase|nr:acetylornithine transaminase [Oscillospiraceae bacterium]
MSTQSLTDQYLAHTYARTPVTFVRGSGSLLWDETGREYIDLGSGIAVNGLGLADEGWAAAVAAQAGALAHTSNLYYTEPQALLAETLCTRAGLQTVFFSNSGAEANECMIKTARKWAAHRWGEAARPGIVTLLGSFHGRTMATLSATGQTHYHETFGPFLPGFYHAVPGDLSSLRSVLAEQKGALCAVMIELIQGEGGVLDLSPAYVWDLAALCAEENLLLLVDEVQTGNGRTGTLFAYEQYGIEPDIVSTAKGLAGGLPLGATLFGPRTAGVLTPGSHGSTFGGNPVCAAAANYVLSRLDEALLSSVRQKSAFLRARLARAPGVRRVTGLGLMVGIETDRPAAEIQAACLAQGLLVLTAKDRLRLLPALTVPDALLARATEILCAAIAG